MKILQIIIHWVFLLPIFLQAQSFEITPNSSLKKEGEQSTFESTTNSILKLTRVANDYFQPATIQFSNRLTNNSVNNILSHAYVSSSLDYFSIRHTYGFARMEFGLATGLKFLIKSDSVITRVNVQNNGFTKLGYDAPAIKIKKLTGTTSSTQGGSVSISHNLDDSKILSINVMVDYLNSASYIPASYNGNPGFEYDWFSDNGVIVVMNKVGNSSGILSKPIKILITYEE